MKNKPLAATPSLITTSGVAVGVDLVAPILVGYTHTHSLGCFMKTFSARPSHSFFFDMLIALFLSRPDKTSWACIRLRSDSAFSVMLYDTYT